MAMQILNSNAYGTLSPATLEKFERTLGALLPGDYREFLLKHNGGKPQPACFMAPDDPLEGEDSPLSEREIVCFLPLHHHAWSDETMEASLAFPIQVALSDFRGEQPESSLLPIARDWSGNYICIGSQGDELGKIFFYDHEYEEASLLAESFETFLSGPIPCQPIE